jgi:hypothetical protein
MGQLFIRFSEPERLQTIYKAKIEKSRFDKKVGVGQQSVIDIIKQAFHSLLTSLWLSIHSLRRKWYLYRATQCFKKAMKIAKIDGQWERYCESASGIAVAMHINQQYRLEVKVLTDAAKHSSILGSAYLTGSIWGQMGLALIFCNEYWRAHASLILAQRITKGGGEAQREEIQNALDILIGRVGDSILFSIESVTLESLQDWELINIILEGK